MGKYKTAGSNIILSDYPDGGDGGGQVIATGTPEEVSKCDTYTGEFLRKILDENITPYAKNLLDEINTSN